MGCWQMLSTLRKLMIRGFISKQYRYTGSHCQTLNLENMFEGILAILQSTSITLANFVFFKIS